MGGLWGFARARSVIHCLHIMSVHFPAWFESQTSSFDQSQSVRKKEEEKNSLVNYPKLYRFSSCVNLHVFPWPYGKSTNVESEKYHMVLFNISWQIEFKTTFTKSMTTICHVQLCS